MWERQGQKCLICRRDVAERAFVIDHDHALAAIHGHQGDEGCRRCVRAILCQRCNALLGSALDDPAILRRAAEYIEIARAAAR